MNLTARELNAMQIVDWAYTEELVPKTYQHYQSWLDQNLQGPLNYLADERAQKRKSLKEVYPQAQSALVFLFDYRAAKNFIESAKPKNKMASYVIGFEDQDYHFWIAEKLKTIAKSLKLDNYGISLDIHPVLERDLAYRAGLGWFGKNTMLLNREHGSLFLIGSLILEQKLTYPIKELQPDHCGQCTRCIDACPTNALLGDKVLDAGKCISTYTIELFKEAPAPQGYPTQSKEVFGCDICQEVCPWVKKTLGEEEIEGSWIVDFFNRPQAEIKTELESLSNKGFKEKFKQTSLERLGKKGLLKNFKD